MIEGTQEEKNFISKVRRLHLSEESTKIVNMHIAATSNDVNIDDCGIKHLCCYIKLCIIIAIWKRLPYDEVKADIMLLNGFFKEIYFL